MLQEHKQRRADACAGHEGRDSTLPCHESQQVLKLHRHPPPEHTLQHTQEPRAEPTTEIQPTDNQPANAPGPVSYQALTAVHPELGDNESGVYASANRPPSPGDPTALSGCPETSKGGQLNAGTRAASELTPGAAAPCCCCCSAAAAWCMARWCSWEPGAEVARREA